MPIAPRARNLIFENADMALQYDTDRRMLDASIAAAWQLGRLLALQAPEFVRTLSAWEYGDIASHETYNALLVQQAIIIIERVTRATGNVRILAFK